MKTAVCAARPGAVIDTLRQDARLALRMMRRAPGFTAASVLTLGVATGLNTTVFTGLDTAVLRPLPYPASDRRVVLGNLYPKLNSADRGQNSVPDYLDRRQLTDVFESLALTVPERRNIGGDPAPQSVVVCRVTPTLFDVLSIRPARGRPFTGSESEPGHERVAILSDGLWRRAFGGSPAAVGATIRVDGIAHQIVGVMPPAA